MNNVPIWKAVELMIEKFDCGEEFLSFFHQMDEDEPAIDIISTLTTLCETYIYLGLIKDFCLLSENLNIIDGSMITQGVISLCILDNDNNLKTKLFYWEG